MDVVVDGLIDDALFEEVLQFLNSQSVRMRVIISTGGFLEGGRFTFLMLRSDRLASMMVWRSADTMMTIGTEASRRSSGYNREWECTSGDG